MKHEPEELTPSNPATPAGEWTRERIERRVAALAPWFHNLDLAGVRTAPDHFLFDYPAVKWREFAHALPGDLAGASVLDIGCNAGFYSLEMKRRGAGRVLGIDWDERYLEQARFVADVNGLAGDMEFRKLSVYDVGAIGERFDVVLFLGVLYHLRHPLLALDLVHEHVAADRLVFQSLQRGSPEIEPVQDDYDFWQGEHFDRPGYPKMHFIEGRYSGDATNWWAPNAACCAAMLRSAGFDIESHPEQEVYVCRRSRTDPADGLPRAVYPPRGPG